jgi:hypothetical protein
MHLQPADAVEFAVPDDGAYWIVVPVGHSGVGFLGDSGKFVSNGNRVARIRDTGSLKARIIFSAGESRLRFYGFSHAQPKVRAVGATIAELTYDSQTSLFYFDLVARPGTSPVVTLRAAQCCAHHARHARGAITRGGAIIRDLIRRDATPKLTCAGPRSCRRAAARTATMVDLARSGRGGVPLLVGLR